MRIVDADPGARPAACESDFEKKLVLPQCVFHAVVLRFSVGSELLLLPHAPNDAIYCMSDVAAPVVVVDEPSDVSRCTRVVTLQCLCPGRSAYRSAGQA